MINNVSIKLGEGKPIYAGYVIRSIKYKIIGTGGFLQVMLAMMMGEMEYWQFWRLCLRLELCVLEYLRATHFLCEVKRDSKADECLEFNRKILT